MTLWLELRSNNDESWEYRVGTKNDMEEVRQKREIGFNKSI